MALDHSTFVIELARVEAEMQAFFSVVWERDMESRRNLPLDMIYKLADLNGLDRAMVTYRS
jgi:hypothetical protein